MSKASPIINALNAGEWSPLLSGRQDLAGYAASASVMENFIPSIQGPAIKRGGTGFIREVNDSTKRTWLVPFIISQTESYMLEFGDSYVRAYYGRSAQANYITLNGGKIDNATQANPVVLTISPNTPFVSGQNVFVENVDGMTEINNRWFVAQNVTSTTIELTTMHGDNVDGTGYSAYIAGSTDKILLPAGSGSPYAEADLALASGEFALDFVQFGTTMYITHRGGTIAPYKLTLVYSGSSKISGTADSFTFTEAQSNDGPYLAMNADPALTIYSSAATGTVTLTASASAFVAENIGSIIRIDQELITSTNGWKTGTAYNAGEFVRSQGHQYKATTSATSGTKIPAHTQGTMNDGDGVGSGGATGVDWEYQSSGYGIARITAVASNTSATATVLTTFPQTLIGSANASSLWRRGKWSIQNGYPTCVSIFRERLAYGQDLSVEFSNVADFDNFAIDSFGEILTENAVSVTLNVDRATSIHSLSSGDYLAAMTRGGEYIINAASSQSPFGPGNVYTATVSSHGSQPIAPIRSGQDVLFTQAGSLKLRALQQGNNGVIAPDMTVRAEHITAGGIKSMAWQGMPHESLWAVRGDGKLLSFSFDKTNEVRGWAQHAIGGSGVVEHAAVMPSPSGDRDDVWVIVRRTINGGTRRYIEYLQPEYKTGDTQASSAYGDSMLTYSGSAATTVYGLDHLEGETVRLLLDGASAPDVTVSNGEISIASSTVAQIGYGFSARYASNRINPGAGDGTSQAKTKRITDVAFRVFNTLGGVAGPDEANLDDVRELNDRNPAVLMGSPPALYTGDAVVAWPGGYETNGYMWYVNDTMFPATIISIMPQVTTSESR